MASSNDSEDVPPTQVVGSSTDPFAGREGADADNQIRSGVTGPTRAPFHHLGQGRSCPLTARYRYYVRLDPGSSCSFVLPDHVIPSSIFYVLPPEHSGEMQSSVVTIFALWNSMLGASLLALPWAVQQSGFLMGLTIMLFIGLVAFYTAYLVVKSPQFIQGTSEGPLEIYDICSYYFGRKGYVIAIIFSLISIAGGAIVYYVLMCNFLYHTGEVIYESLHENKTNQWIVIKNLSEKCDVNCVPGAYQVEDYLRRDVTEFDRVWTMQGTLPFYLLILIFPLLNIKSPTFFAKFNGLGAVSIAYLIIFLFLKMGECGINLNLSDAQSIHYDPGFRITFPALSGSLSLSFFCHCFVLSILRNQKNPENNARDLGVAYILVAITYVIVAFGFFLAFPVQKSCIADNFLNNFASGDLMASIARLLLFVQLGTVYPLVTYIIRVQFMHAVFGSVYPSWIHVFCLNGVMVGISIIFAVFMPQIGTIVRFVGSVSGLVFIFLLPSVFYLKYLQSTGGLKLWHKVVHGGLFVVGVLNLLAQFALLR